jgi:hypothetical protein
MEEDLKKDEATITNISPRPASSSSEILSLDLVSRLVGIKDTGYQLQLLGNFFPYIPSRVGHNTAIDAALRCLLSDHQNLLSQDSSAFKEGRNYLSNYNQAVYLIRKDLNLQRKVSSETVCAAMILMSCEVRILQIWLLVEYS